MEFKLRAYGHQAFEFVLRDAADRSDDLVPILDVVGRRMLKSEKRLFETSGKSAGAPWEPLESLTIKRKDGKKKPLIRTGKEMRSLSSKSAQGNIYRATRLYVIIGSTQPGVEHQAQGTKWMPARPPIMFTEGQAQEWTDLVNDFIFTGRVPSA